MQLKIKRSQREGGVMKDQVIFCLDARVGFTPEEANSINRYKLQNQVIYNSEAAKRYLDKGDAVRDGSMVGSLKSLGLSALAAMRLNISIASLARGQHIECKSLDELLGAEEAIMTACQNLRGYLETAATFDGREMLFDFATGKPEVVAQAVTPAPMLVAPDEPPPAPVPEPLIGSLPPPMPERPLTALEQAAMVPEPSSQSVDEGMVVAPIGMRKKKPTY